MRFHFTLVAIAALTACSANGAAGLPPSPQAQPDRHAGMIYCHEQDAQVSGSSLERGPVFLTSDPGYRFTHVAVTNGLTQTAVTVYDTSGDQPVMVVQPGQLGGRTYRPSTHYLELSDGQAIDSGTVSVQTKICRG